MADKVETSTSSAAMATNIQGSAKVGEERSNCRKHKNILKQHHLLLMETLDPHLFLDMLHPFLRSQIHEKMTKEEKTRQLLQNLSRGPVDMFDKFCRVIAGLNPDVFLQLQGRRPTREEADFFFKSFYEDLCAGIIDAGSKTDNEVDKRIDLDTEFVNLKLTDRQFDEVNSTVSSYKMTGSESSDTDEEYDAAQGHQLGEQKIVDEDIDVSEILPQNFSGKSVLLQGKAGVGKSTLTQYVAREWAKGRWGTAFTGVFLLNLRKLVHVKQEMSLSQLLGMYAEYTTGAPDPDKPSVEWLEQNAEKVLIFTDGIDELPELSKLLKRTPNLKMLNLKATPLDWCINLIQKNVLPQCTTVVVSRPFIGLRNLKYDREIEVFGLTPDMVMQFVDKNVESSRKEAVKETLLKNPLLLSVCTVTFYCSALCKVLEQDMSLDRASLTTYTRITAYLIRKFVSRNTAEESTLSVTPEEFSECLMELAALAYYGLLGSGQDNTHLVFDQTDFNHVDFPPSKMKAAKKTGLLLYKDVKTVLSPQLQAEFVHLSIQEFLAMASLAKAEEHEVRQFFKSSLGRFNMSKLFAYGIFLDKENPDIQAIHQTVMRNTDKNVQQGTLPITDILVEIFHEMCNEVHRDEKSWLNLMQIAYESQRPDLAMAIGNAVAPKGEFELKLRQLTLIDLRAVFFCLTHAKVHKVTCSHIMVDTDLGQKIQKHIETASETITLEFKNTNLTDGGMLHLAEGMQTSTNLKHLKFIDNVITDQGMDYLAQGIISSTSLVSLFFFGGEISDKGMQRIAQGIAESTSLSSLTFHHNEISNEGWKLLSEGIKVTKSLKSLKLERLDITGIGMSHLSSGIECSTSMETLHLRQCDHFDRSVGIKAATSLKNLHYELYVFHDMDESDFVSKSLRKLRFEKCDFEKTAEEQLSSYIASSGIEHLQLMQNTYKDNAKLLHKGFRLSTSLVQLTVGGDHNNETMQHLSECIALSKSLVVLDVECLSASSASVMCLFDAIASSTCLKRLQFHRDTSYYNGIIMTEIYHHLPRLLTRNNVLNHLVFREVTFSDSMMQHLSEGVAASRTLIRLEFLSCTLSAQGIVQLFKGIQVARNLESVQFIHNKTTEEGQELLAQCILGVPASCELVV